MLDTNILISAFIFKSSKMNSLIEKLSVEHEIVICSYTIDELNELIKEKFNVSRKTRNMYSKWVSWKILKYLKTKKVAFQRLFYFGGDRGIRTLAALANPNSLANCPLRPAWVCLHKIYADLLSAYCMAERVGFEPTVRSHVRQFSRLVP